MQYYWADNQVSCTITFSKEEAKDIPKILELYETRLKSVSFLPLTDHKYEQAPYIEMLEEEYNEAIKKIKPLDLSNLNDTNEVVEKYCDGEACQI